MIAAIIMPAAAPSLLTDPIPRLVRQIAIPVSIGMFFQTMFNVVDTWAAGRLSTEALAALSASFPVFFLMIGVSHGCQAATNSLISHALGRNDEETARELAGQALFFAVWMSLLIGAAGWWAAPWLFSRLGVEGEVFRLSVAYIRTIFMGTSFFALNATLNGMLMARGNSRPFRDSLIVSFFGNIVLDLWFVFGGLGLAPMGFPGIARATVLLQACTTVFLWVTAVRARLIPPSGFAHLHPRLRAQRRLMGQGLPAMLNMLTISIGIFVYTFFASRAGTDVLAAYGIGTRIEQLALLPTIGLNAAAMTLAGHSLGAGRLDRLRETVLTCFKFGAVLYLIGAPLVFTFAPQLMRLFTTEPHVVEIGVGYLRIAMFTFYAFVILFTTTSSLQGMQRPMYAIWIGMYRQLLMPVLLISWLMPRVQPPELGIWAGGFASTWSGALITLGYLLWTWRRLNRRPAD